LSLLTETGLAGMGLYLALLFGWAQGAWRMWRSSTAPDWVRTQGLVMLGLLGIYAGPAMFFDLTYSPHDHWIVFFMAGTTAGLWPLVKPATETAPALPGNVTFRRAAAT